MKILTISTITLAFLSASTVASLAAEPAVAEIFSPGMVLQRDTPIPVWGSAPDGTEVTVSLGASKATAKAAGGKWRVNLPAEGANTSPRKMVVSFPEGKVIEIDDVLVGEVWLCAGQSNMDQRISKSPPRELRDMPLVRQFASGRGKDSAKGSQWKAATAENINLLSMTAIYFGENLHRELNVPIGLILTAVSGTPIESWTPKEALLADTEIAALVERAGDNEVRRKLSEARKKMREDSSQGIDPELAKLISLDKPGRLYSLHIEPTVPYAIRGVIWYQGEANSKVAGNAQLYGKYLGLLVTSLREAYEQKDLPFYLVQLPSIAEGNRKERNAPLVYEIVREQQRRFVQSTPHTGLAVTIDVNEGLHPRNKNVMGDRLARVALAETYNKKTEVPHAGPLLKSVQFEGGRAICTFAHDEGGLVLKNAGASLFELAGEDGVFHPATASPNDNRLVVESPQIKNAKAVRYAFKPSMPEVCLFGSGGIPASPFLYP